jgi:hypothetical protein
MLFWGLEQNHLQEVVELAGSPYFFSLGACISNLFYQISDNEKERGFPECENQLTTDFPE